MEDALIDNETTRTAVKNDVTEAQQLDQYMDALQQSIADKQTTLDSNPYINADPNKNKIMTTQFKMLKVLLLE